MLKTKQSEIRSLDVCDADEERAIDALNVSFMHSTAFKLTFDPTPVYQMVLNSMQGLKREVDDLYRQVESQSQQVTDRYSSRATPASIAQQMQSAELLSESVSEALNDKESDFKRCCTMRWEFKRDVEELGLWLQQSTNLLEDKSMLPQQTFQSLQVIYISISYRNDLPQFCISQRRFKLFAELVVRDTRCHRSTQKDHQNG